MIVNEDRNTLYFTQEHRNLFKHNTNYGHKLYHYDPATYMSLNMTNGTIHTLDDTRKFLLKKEIKEWCKNSLKGKITQNDFRIKFDNTDDVILFKLTWN